MGIGSWLSRFIGRGLVARFVPSSCWSAWSAASRPRCCFSPSPTRRRFRLLLYVLVIVIGILVGLEIPLLMRILQGPLPVPGPGRPRPDLRLPGRARRVAAVPAAAGAAARAGALGAAVRDDQRRASRCGRTWLFRDAAAARARRCAPACVVVLVLLGVGMARRRPHHRRWPRTTSTPTRSILAANTRYQRIVLTALEGRPAAVPQLAPAVQLARRVPLPRGAGASRAWPRCPAPRRVLVLGGGDGLAVREILQVPERRAASRWSISIRR